MGEELTDEELYIKYSDSLVRFAATIVGPAEAEDVMIEGVVSALDSRKWRHVRDKRAYLYKSVLNAGRMLLRSNRRRLAREDRAFRADPRPAFASPYDLTPEVRSAIGALSARQRAVVFLTYWEDLDERGVANRLGIGVGSVRRHLHRARQSLERLLDE